MPHTFIILDGHPQAFTQLPSIEITSVPPTHQLPPLPLWACMIQNTLDFCRIAWDIEQSSKNTINVLVAGGSTIEINKSTEQNIDILHQKFPHAQPRESYSHDRLQPAIATALHTFSTKNKADHWQRCRILVVLIAKNPMEKSFHFSNNPNEPTKDIRPMVYNTLKEINAKNLTKPIHHVQVDILKIQHYSDTPQIENSIAKQISPEITMSAYHIPYGRDQLKFAMRNLCLLYYNINMLHISNIPMKSEQNEQTTQTISLYYQANGKHLVNQPTPLANTRIDHPQHLQHRQLDLIYSKRSKKALSESEWCTCMHSISPIKLHDLATEVYLDMTLGGNISYLVTPGSSTWSHMLIAQHRGIFLHCLDSNIQAQFVNAKNETTRHVPLNYDYDAKTQEMVNTIIKPCLYDNIHEFLMSTTVPSTKVIPIQPARYAHDLPLTKLDEKKLYTTRWIEKSTRWRTCFRDCEGTDMFPITLDSTRSIAYLAEDVLNGVPLASGFGLAFGLIHDLLEQLQDVFFKDQIDLKSIVQTEKLIQLIVSQLVDGMSGTTGKLFIKGLNKQDTSLLSKKLLVGLYIVGKRFKNDSDGHEKLCTYLLSMIDEKTTVKEDEIQKEQVQVKSEHEVHVDAAWSQVNRYENMSLREKEEEAKGFAPDFKMERNIARTNTPPAINPNFKSRRGVTSQNNRVQKPKYDPNTVAIPYLTYIAPTLEEKASEEEAEEESLGKPGNLLWLHWMGEKSRRRGNTEEGDLSSGTELVYKNNQWKRIKKEFQGRIAQPGEQGEML